MWHIYKVSQLNLNELAPGVFRAWRMGVRLIVQLYVSRGWFKKHFYPSTKPITSKIHHFKRNLDRDTKGQCHHHFTSSFFVRKCFEQLLFVYSFCLLCFRKRKSVHKLIKKCWQNWLHLELITLLCIVFFPLVFSVFYLCYGPQIVNTANSEIINKKGSLNKVFQVD